MPLTALGMICDGSKLSSCSPKLRKAAFPGTEMSAPESGSVHTSAFPLRNVI